MTRIVIGRMTLDAQIWVPPPSFTLFCANLNTFREGVSHSKTSGKIERENQIETKNCAPFQTRILGIFNVRSLGRTQKGRKISWLLV